MSICPKAKKMLDEEGIVLSKKACDQLSKYDDHDQCGIVANPKVFGILERCVNQILNGMQGNTNFVGESHSVNNTKEKINVCQEVVNVEKEVKKIDSDSDSEEIPMFDLFG